jgi:hypothetical protein
MSKVLLIKIKDILKLFYFSKVYIRILNGKVDLDFKSPVPPLL